MEQLKYKLIVLGDSNVGKSTLIKRYCDNVFEDQKSTKGIDYKIKIIKYKEKSIELCIWDSAGTEKFRSLMSSFYRGSHGVLIIYDITNKNSLYKLDGWMKDIEKASIENLVKILVGVKCDLESDREVPTKQGHSIADYYGIPFFEVSSKTSVNLDNMFYTMVSKIHDLKPTISLSKKESLILHDHHKSELVNNEDASKCFCGK